MNDQRWPGQPVCLALVTRVSRLFLLGLLLLLAASTVSHAQSPDIRKGFRLIDIEQPSKGIAAIEQAVQANPAELYYLGLGYIRTGQLDKALATFDKGINENKKDGLSMAGKGHVMLLKKNPTEAKALFEEAKSVTKSKNADVWRAIGAAYLSDSKYLLDAIEALEKAKSINGGDPETHLLLGDAYLLQNRGGESVSSYERAARADSKLGKPHYKIGKVYQRSRNNEMSLQSFNKAISTDPEYAPAYKELGETYYLQKDAKKAVEAYEKYLAISENPGQAKFQYAFFLFMAKDYQKANEIFKEVLTDKNASPTALKFYAYSLVEQDKNDEARKILEQYFQKVKPEDIQASDYASYGKLLLKLNEDSLANETFAKGIVLDSADQEVLQLHAETFMKRKKYAEAAQAYEDLAAARSTPLSQDLWYLGQAYYFSDQFAEADSAFSKLAERQPNMTIGYLWAGRSRQQIDSTGTQGLAKPMYEAVVEKAQENPEKYKKDLIEAYDYLGTYSLQIEDNVVQAKNYFQKILELDPSYERAKQFMKELNKPAPKG